MRLLHILWLWLACNPALAQVNFYSQLADSALTLTYQQVQYDPAYFSLDYPNGDVPADKGVCTDVVIRAYRKLGIDLQKAVHEDMRANFSLYPNHWGLTRPDKNIDHRRVPNLMVYFKRHSIVKNISQDAADYQPGDIVCWQLQGGMTHIGIVSSKKSTTDHTPLIIHNIGTGQVIENMLFDYPIIGHYSFNSQ